MSTQNGRRPAASGRGPGDQQVQRPAPTAPSYSLAERRSIVAALTRAGWSATRIAPVVGVRPESIWRIRRDAGQPAGRAPRFFTEDEDRRARELLAAGESLKTVARLLGREHKVVARHFPDAPRVSPQEAGARGVLVQRGDREMRRIGRAAA